MGLVTVYDSSIDLHTADDEIMCHGVHQWLCNKSIF